jgi:hypothetical protein
MWCCVASYKFSNVLEESTISIFTHSKERGSIYLLHFAEFVQGRVIGHRISRQPSTEVAQFQSQTSSRGICSRVGDTESAYFSSPCQWYYINAPFAFICLSRKLCFLTRRTASSCQRNLVFLMTGLQEFKDKQRPMLPLLIYSIPSSLTFRHRNFILHTLYIKYTHM